MPQVNIEYSTLDNTQFARVFDHAISQTRDSAQALLDAVAAHIRQEPMPNPIWHYRLAHDANLDRIETLLDERDRRAIP